MKNKGTEEVSLLIIDWYREHKRSLPWRDTCDPYKIWVSEIILQQTRVVQGLSYYLRFMSRFPNVAVLAAADESEVLKYWEGLGYYSRARNLHQAAQQIVAQGAFPNTFEEIRKQTGCIVMYSDEMLDKDAKVDAVFEDASLEEVLREVLAGKGLTYEKDGEFIIISPPILHRLIEKVKMSSEKELSVDIDRLFPRSYQEYLLNVINSNSDEPYFSYEYITKTPLDQEDLFKIAEHQLEDIKIEDVNCFDTVRLLEKRGHVLELNCSNGFWIACKNSEAVFQYSNPDGTLEIIKVEV